MSDHEYPARHPSIETAVFDTEAVLYDERSGMVHHLNPPACAIWLLLDGRPVADIVTALANAAGIPPTEIRTDVLDAIDKLTAAGLIGD